MAQEQESTYDYDSIDPGYYDAVFKRTAGVQSKWHHLKFRHVRNAMPSGFRSHLDVACGPGTFVGTLPGDVRSAGVDLAAPQVEYAGRKYGTDEHTFQTMSAGRLPFDEGSFDVVTMVELIEHLEVGAIEELLGEVRRVLEPGGKIVVTTPNYASLWPLLEKVVNARAEVSYEDQHITFFTRKRVLSLLRGCGFGSVEATTFQGVAPFVAGLSWKLADGVQKVENPILSRGMGFLLLGTGVKE